MRGFVGVAFSLLTPDQIMNALRTFALLGWLRGAAVGGAGLGLVVVLGVMTFAVPGVRAEAGAALNQAREAFEAGEKAYAAGNLDAARQHMLRAYKLTKSPEIAYNIAKVCDRMSDARPAVHYYEVYLKSGKADTKEAKAIKARIADLSDLDRRYKAQIFELPPSKDELTAEARRFFLAGVDMFNKRNYQAASQAFSAAGRFSPAPEITFNLALTFEAMGNNEYARDQYREYLRQRPKAADRDQIEARIKALAGR